MGQREALSLVKTTNRCRVQQDQRPDCGDFPGEEGLLVLEGREVDLVVSDYSMPRMNGVEFLQKVKS